MSPNRDAVLDRWASGETTDRIAHALGITRNSVVGIVRRARGVNDPRVAQRARKARRVPCLDHDAILNRYAVGASCRAIAEEMKCPEGSIANAILSARTRGDERAARRYNKKGSAPRDDSQPQTAVITLAKAIGAILPQSNAQPTDDRISILSVRFGQCRFPVAGSGLDMEMCGERVRPGCPYCATHALVAYRPPVQRKRGGQATAQRVGS